MIKLSDVELASSDKRFVAEAFHTVSDIERIGDYAENISEYAEKLREYKQTFSSESLAEIETLRTTLETMFDLTVRIYEDNDASLIPELYTHEQNADEMKILMGNNHISRLHKGVCTPEAGALYLSLASDCERIADHLTNVANTVKLPS